ncbi:MAG TPA: AAA family ATPase [Aeromicrobium sp.]|nr:AAA family ATPase [Aeromicrobium sp.]
MWISRVRVNGGFLAGLDVRLEPGLNVVIGPRGAGKTTLLELVRHALGIQHADEAVARRQQQAVTQMLGAGEVILELQDTDSSLHLVVDASGSGVSVNTTSMALALGQNELEGIASSSASRLNLIDIRASVEATPPSLEDASSLTQQLAAVRTEIDRLEEGTTRREVLESDRAEAVAQEQALLAESAAEIAGRRDVLRSLESKLLQLTAQAEFNDTALSSTTRAQELATDLTAAVEEIAPPDAGVALTAILDPKLGALRETLGSTRQQVNELLDALRLNGRSIAEQRNRLRLQAEPVRAELEAAESGLGQVTARLRNLDSELATLARADIRKQDLTSRLRELEAARDAVLDEYEHWQESLYEARRQIADSVSAELQNRVVVSVEHLADTTRFRDTLVQLLQGSGLQYRPLSESLSRALLPRQLVALVEASDAQGLAHATGIAPDRAARVVAHLSAPDAIAAVATCILEDEVDFRLRDGSIEKSVEELSTGQKCAVTLPIVLTELSRVLILDQPEDHLDNAYLVAHVVRALETRSEHQAQTIIATHNANIPVLGSAPVVVSLESDGARGYASALGAFDDGDIVSVITSLMEGGRDAFRRRAAFYDSHGVGDE